MESSTRKNYVQVGLHLLFWAVVTYFMVKNSILRPHTRSLIKECSMVLLLMASSYLSYFLLVPKLFVRQKKYTFFLLSIGLALLCGFIEITVCYNAMKECIFSYCQKEDPTGHLWHIYLLNTCLVVSARYAGFILFFEMIQLLHVKEAQIQKQNELSVQKMEAIFVGKDPNKMNVIPYKTIFLIAYNNRYVSVVCADGKEYKEYSSLSSFTNKLPENQFVKINRNTIISLNYLKYYTQSTVVLKNSATCMNFPISYNFPVLGTLQQLVPDLYREEEEGEM